MAREEEPFNKLPSDVSPEILTQDDVRAMSKYEFDIFFRSDVPRRFIVLSDSILSLKLDSKRKRMSMFASRALEPIILH